MKLKLLFPHLLSGNTRQERLHVGLDNYFHARVPAPGHTDQAVAVISKRALCFNCLIPGAAKRIEETTKSSPAKCVHFAKLKIACHVPGTFNAV